MPDGTLRVYEVCALRLRLKHGLSEDGARSFERISFALRVCLCPEPWVLTDTLRVCLRPVEGYTKCALCAYGHGLRPVPCNLWKRHGHAPLNASHSPFGFSSRLHWLLRRRALLHRCYVGYIYCWMFVTQELPCLTQRLEVLLPLSSQRRNPRSHPTSWDSYWFVSLEFTRRAAYAQRLDKSFSPVLSL